VTARSCSAPSPIELTSYENQSARAVDLGTTWRVAPRVHSPSNNRPERNENCVTHVVGLKCYPCRRLLSDAKHRGRVRGSGLSIETPHPARTSHSRCKTSAS